MKRMLIFVFFVFYLKLVQGQQIDKLSINLDSTVIANSFSDYLDCYCVQSFVNRELKHKKTKVKVNVAFYSYQNSSYFLGIPYSVFDSIGKVYIYNEFNKYISAYPNEYTGNYLNLCIKTSADIKQKYVRIFYQNYYIDEKIRK